MLPSHAFTLCSHRVRRLAIGWVLQAAVMTGSPVFGQYAGTQSPFVLGAGARAISLGNAYVALASDATAIYWNPAGLDRMQRKELVFFYSPILEGTSYNFIGYAHPTLQLGTFGLGVLHLATGDIQFADEDGRRGDTFSYSRSQFLLSYSRVLMNPLRLGGTLKVERMQLHDGTAAGIGFDLGFSYTPEIESRAFQNLAFGLTVYNLVSPRLKLNNVLESMPWRIRGGIAKSIGFGGADADGINLLLGIETARDAAAKLNFGSEYVFQNRAMLRIGHNGSSISFGGGLMYQSFQIDYSFGKYGDDKGFFGPQHRVSLNFEFGRTRGELIELARQEELRRIEQETERQVTLHNKLEFQRLMERGKSYFEQGDYFIALIRFSAARDLVPEDADARRWVQRTQELLDEQRKKEAALLAQREREQVTEAAKAAFIQAQFENGQKFLEAGRLRDAITEWERGLERDPENTVLKEWIAKTREEIKTRAADILRRAASAEKSKNITVALELYDQALSGGLDEENERKTIQLKIAALRRQLTFNDLFREGLTAYINKDYRNAIKNFEEALKVKSDDAKVKQYLDDAEARANARIEEFADEKSRIRFLEAVRLIQKEEYQKALEILTELQQQQRYNKRILDAIDLARDRLSR